MQFLSTLPARGATAWVEAGHCTFVISIHAPREGSDWKPRPGAAEAIQFLSTLPARGATAHCWRSWSKLAFLSTLPARGATVFYGFCLHILPISIHAPREGSDWLWATRAGWAPYFYPRSPRGERHGFM